MIMHHEKAKCVKKQAITTVTIVHEKFDLYLYFVSSIPDIVDLIISTMFFGDVMSIQHNSKQMEVSKNA